ncbi:hydroxymethylbilane synthase [Varunaivibrio sulfuroxidans]|uniref:Porphobilinogen deaminase n=1 Tax=Varunaivibrio sulfuroxidans TaxID=1773489 RepID=A0A4R3JFY5_9PROT|nr:hydroxymethylbilane synthase [Varunaivibrio sulfuroxidans]TCS64814.1 hydroxymethylbilane synthase [Varunaivibrio sulfuroxidans]WES29885.1 hydroxymethylbilane synthase [Varunaivibrio sulfuroxidans]
MHSDTPFRIGTRGSPLALAQAEETRARLVAAFPDLGADGAIDIVVIKTTGDKVLDKALADVGGKGLFTKEIDDAMLSGAIDIAVHSMKDVPTWLPEGIVLPCMLEREDTRDVFISTKAADLDDLPPGAVVGSASLRRQAQILARRPDLKVVTFRGNVQTRLKKLAAGEVDATLLALAGLKRMNMAHVATKVLDWDAMTPAVGQGAIGITCRGEDRRALAALDALNHPDTFLCVSAERAFLAELDGSCRTPIAARATLKDGALDLHALIARVDGSEVHRQRGESPAALDDALALGRALGQSLLARASVGFFDGVA